MSTILQAGNATSGAVVSSDTAGSLQIQTGSTPTTAVTVDSSQNVGIGTSSPANFGSNFKMLAVQGTDYGVIQAVSSSGSTTIEMMGASGTGYLGTRTNHPMVFRTYDTERMRIDSSGRITTPFQTAFRAYAGTNANYSTADTKITVYDQIAYNIGSNYSTSTIRFTAPVAGIYMFIARAWALQGNTSAAGIQLKQNGVGVGTLRIASSQAEYSTLQPAVTIQMAVNDYVEVYTESCSATGAIHTSSGIANSLFSGYLLG